MQTWVYVAIPVMIYLGERVLRMIRSMVYDAKILDVCDHLQQIFSTEVQLYY